MSAEGERSLVAAALVDEWLAARLWVAVPSGPVEITQGTAAHGERFPIGREAIHLVTAWNPDARPLSARENAARHERLVAELAAASIAHWPAAGYATDTSWIEHGLALPELRTDEALAIGRRFGQLALYRWRPDQMETLHCATGAVLAASAWTARARAVPPEAPPG